MDFQSIFSKAYNRVEKIIGAIAISLPILVFALSYPGWVQKWGYTLLPLLVYPLVIRVGLELFSPIQINETERNRLQVFMLAILCNFIFPFTPVGITMVSIAFLLLPSLPLLSQKLAFAWIMLQQFFFLYQKSQGASPDWQQAAQWVIGIILLLHIIWRRRSSILNQTRL